MPYLIDGHNLIGQLPDIDLTDPNDEAKLVTKLRAYSARTRKKCVVIFDHGLPGGKSKMSNSAVNVFFAARPGEADDVMLKRIRTTRDVKSWTVVSSDERVLQAARQQGMNTQRAEHFAEALNAKPTPPPKEENPNVQLTNAEVEAWLKLFEGD